MKRPSRRRRPARGERRVREARGRVPEPLALAAPQVAARDEPVAGTTAPLPSAAARATSNASVSATTAASTSRCSRATSRPSPSCVAARPSRARACASASTPGGAQSSRRRAARSPPPASSASRPARRGAPRRRARAPRARVVGARSCLSAARRRAGRVASTAAAPSLARVPPSAQPLMASRSSGLSCPCARGPGLIALCSFHCWRRSRAATFPRARIRRRGVARGAGGRGVRGVVGRRRHGELLGGRACIRRAEGERIGTTAPPTVQRTCNGAAPASATRKRFAAARRRRRRARARLHRLPSRRRRRPRQIDDVVQGRSPDDDASLLGQVDDDHQGLEQAYLHEADHEREVGAPLRLMTLGS